MFKLPALCCIPSIQPCSSPLPPWSSYLKVTWDAVSRAWSPKNSHQIKHYSQLLCCDYFFFKSTPLWWGFSSCSRRQWVPPLKVLWPEEMGTQKAGSFLYLWWLNTGPESWLCFQLWESCCWHREQLPLIFSVFPSPTCSRDAQLSLLCSLYGLFLYCTLRAGHHPKDFSDRRQCYSHFAEWETEAWEVCSWSLGCCWNPQSHLDALLSEC